MGCWRAIPTRSVSERATLEERRANGILADASGWYERTSLPPPAKRLPRLRFLKNRQGSSPSAWRDAKMACLAAVRSVIRFMGVAGVSLESLIDQQRTD